MQISSSCYTVQYSDYDSLETIDVYELEELTLPCCRNFLRLISHTYAQMSEKLFHTCVQ